MDASQAKASEATDRHQFVRVSAQINGMEERLEVSFDDETGVGRARELAIKAEQIIQDVTAEPLSACYPRGTPTEQQREWRLWQRESVLAAKDTVVELDVGSEGPVSTVIQSGTLELTFTQATDHSAAEQVCWDIQIVIT